MVCEASEKVKQVGHLQQTWWVLVVCGIRPGHRWERSTDGRVWLLVGVGVGESASSWSGKNAFF